MGKKNIEINGILSIAMIDYRRVSIDIYIYIIVYIQCEAPQDSVQLVHITPMSLWFMVPITN